MNYYNILSSKVFDAGDVEYVHGSVLVKDTTLMFSTRTSPCKVVRFNKLSDLSDVDILTLPIESLYQVGWGDVLVYSEVTDRCYVLCSAFWQKYSILEIDQTKSVMTQQAVVIDEGTYEEMYSGTISVDGAYLYSVVVDVSTAEKSTVRKYSLNERDENGLLVLVAEVEIPKPGYAHSSVVENGLLYITGNGDSGPWAAIIDLETFTLVRSQLYEDYGAITDDIAITNTHLYCGIEDNLGTVLKINKSTLKATAIDTGIHAYIFATVYDGEYVWVALSAIPSILVSINPLDNTTKTYIINELNGLNEILYDSNRLLYVSNFVAGAVPTKILKLEMLHSNSVSFTVTSNTTVKAKAFKYGVKASETVTKAYIINT